MILGDCLLLYTVLMYGLSVILYYTGFLQWFIRENLNMGRPPDAPLAEFTVIAAPIALFATLTVAFLMVLVWLLQRLKS